MCPRRPLRRRMGKVKVHWCGICGSDLHEYVAGPIFIPVDAPHPLTGAQAPIILGHEFSGEIVEVGEGVTGWSVGDRVAPDACQRCGECYLCKRNMYNICDVLAFTGLMTDGAFAEYVNVPANTLFRIPDNVTMEAAALIEPLAGARTPCAWQPRPRRHRGHIRGADRTPRCSRLWQAGPGGLRGRVARGAEACAQNGATLIIDPNEVDPSRG